MRDSLNKCRLKKVKFFLKYVLYTVSVTVKRSIQILLPLCFIYDEKKFIEKMSEALISSFLVSDVSKSLRSLTKNERCEQIAHVAHQN